MANNNENLAALIETTRENLWFISQQDIPLKEAEKLREEMSRPLGVLVSKQKQKRRAKFNENIPDDK